MDWPDLLAPVEKKLQGPILILGGAARTLLQLVESLPTDCQHNISTFQWDLHQAARVREVFQEASRAIEVFALPDIWDLTERYPTIIFPVFRFGDRELKLDMMEQARHVLAPGGLFVSLSEYEKDSLIPKQQKELFGKCSEAPGQSVYWSIKDKETPRRRHEVVFHARLDANSPSRTFRSWPGVFSYGRMDNGGRALIEAADIQPGDSILDLGCGVGTNGILIAHKTSGPITFVDSQPRACALTELNLRENQITTGRVIASSTLEELEENSFDIVLANPPYFGQTQIARKFMEMGKRVLKPGGRLYLVTKMLHEIAQQVEDVFPDSSFDLIRNYSVVRGVKE